jgi:signal transduction histidine kinase
MKIRDLSVRNKLLITNMLMIIIPISIVIIITSLLMPAWVYFVKGMNPEARLTDSLGFISVYQLQRNVSNLEKQIAVQATVNSLEVTASADGSANSETKAKANRKEKPKVLLTAQTLNICNDINNTGAMLAVLLDNETLYLTKGSTLGKISALFATVNQSGDIYKDSMINASHAGTVLTDVSKLSTGETLRIIVANPSMTGVVGGTDDSASGNLINYSDNLIKILFVIAIAAVLITNGLLAIISAKGILEPLKKLRTATHEIRDGNLDFDIGYKSKNEIGQVCSDFDEMRLRLKRSVEAQQRYEENRVEMIAGISHDLGTPLTSIKGYTSGLIDGIADTPEKRTHYLRIIYNTANDMDKLVNELSMSSKLDLNKIPFYFEKLEISAFFEDCREELSTTLARNKITVIFKNLCPKSKFVSVDVTQFRRAIMNIIDNCIKYKRTDGICGEVILSLSPEDDTMIKIIIADNGIGVPEDELEKIFYRFYRSDKARTNVSSGSGLGLAITRQIIERHNGKIWAQLNEGSGLSINILLPVLPFEKRDV